MRRLTGQMTFPKRCWAPSKRRPMVLLSSMTPPMGSCASTGGGKSSITL